LSGRIEQPAGFDSSIGARDGVDLAVLHRWAFSRFTRRPLLSVAHELFVVLNGVRFGALG